MIYMNTPIIKTYEGLVMNLKPNQFLVITTNTQGRHGKGNALLGYKHYGAIYGQSRGFQGQCYGICTKDLTKSVHPSISKEDIVKQIAALYDVADCFLEEFIIPYTLASNLNGYTPEEMANMFVEASLGKPIPNNIIFNDQFAKLIDPNSWASKTI